MADVLIVEDDLSIAELQRDYLEIQGFSTEIQENGIRALEMVKAKAPRLVILDLMLPGMDGFNLCRELRRVYDGPILMVSARVEEVDKIRGLGLGADDYITKPFSPQELVARVKAHLSRYERLMSKSGFGSGGDGVLSAGNININRNSCRVKVNGEEIALTGKEYELLLLMVENPERVFSKEELFSLIWNSSFGDLSTVTVHIRRLREKIEIDSSSPRYIQTLWGVGYRFSC